MGQKDSHPANTELFEVIKSGELFRSLERDQFQKIAPFLVEVRLKKGSVLFRQEDADQSLYIVAHGRLGARIQSQGQVIELGEIGPGEAVGEIQLLTGGRRTAEVTASEDTELVKLTRSAVDALGEADPDLIRGFLEVIRRRLRHNQLAGIVSRVFGKMDFDWSSIESQCNWVHLTRGEMLSEQDSPSECLWILVSGRLVASVKDEAGKERVVGEISSGESVGEMSVVTGENRTATVHAIRESDLLEIPKEVFDQIVEQRPQILKAVARRVIKRLRRTIETPKTKTAETIVLLPAGLGVPLAEFARRFSAALEAHGKVVHLSSERLENLLGVPGIGQFPPGDPHAIRLGSWLEAKESQCRFMILETDFMNNHWTRLCLQQATRIVIVGKAESDPTPGELEAATKEETAILRRDQVLVLLHKDGSQPPSGTSHWLEPRKVSDHHHVRWDSNDDFERLARFFGGQAVGLVLGGGGARGLAHIGVYFALLEAGIPIDVIGGTSMGAVIGGQCAVGWDQPTMLANNREGLIRQKPFKEYTLPIMSLLRCRKLDSLVQDYLGSDTRIEDLWLKYFCISSDLTNSSMVVHQRGLLWKAIRASASLPGIATPVIDEGRLLVDGGLVNNLPADVMRRFCSTVIVSNVSGESALRAAYETHPSPWQLAWNRIVPGGKDIEVPTIGQVLIRSTLLASAAKTAEALREADLCLEPPIQEYGLLEFEAVDELVEAGYRHAKERIEVWQQKVDSQPSGQAASAQPPVSTVL